MINSSVSHRLTRTMIDRYKDRQGQVYIIKEMEDSHLLNAHRYFAIRRQDLSKKVGITGEILLSISLLINALWQEIGRRELLKY